MPLPTFEELMAEKDALSVSDAALCREAGIDKSTIMRWRTGRTKPQLDVWETKIIPAFERIKAAMA